jgi:hypothetical protein
VNVASARNAARHDFERGRSEIFGETQEFNSNSLTIPRYVQERFEQGPEGICEKLYHFIFQTESDVF